MDADKMSLAAPFAQESTPDIPHPLIQIFSFQCMVCCHVLEMTAHGRFRFHYFLPMFVVD
jgi:hypothetical protein